MDVQLLNDESKCAHGFENEPTRFINNPHAIKEKNCWEFPVFEPIFGIERDRERKKGLDAVYLNCQQMMSTNRTTLSWSLMI